MLLIIVSISKIIQMLWVLLMQQVTVCFKQHQSM